MNNKGLQSRREFFKQTTKKTLPILGFAFLFTTPFLNSCSKDSSCSNCNSTCVSGCTDECTSS